MIKEKTAIGGAIAAAFAASLCCVAPLIFVLLGFGTLGMAAVFEPIRPYLMGGAVMLLSLAYYWIYFRSQAKCPPGESCETKTANQTSRFGLWFATFAVILFALTPYIIAPLLESAGAKETNAPPTDDCCIANKSTKTANSNADHPPANSKRVTFTVTGMTCVTCEPVIRLALEKTTGVKRADISYERSQAVIDYDPMQTTPKELRDVINGTGYKVKE